MNSNRSFGLRFVLLAVSLGCVWLLLGGREVVVSKVLAQANTPPARGLQPDEGYADQDDPDFDPSNPGNLSDQERDSLINLRLKRYTTYQCQTEFVRGAIALEPIDKVNLDACKIDKTTKGSLSAAKALGADNAVVTLRAKIPLWTWLNSTNAVGTVDSPILPPCVLTLQDYKDGTGQLNFANKFACRANIGGNTESTKSMPIAWNGIACIYAEGSYRERRLNLGYSPVPIANITSGVLRDQSTALENQLLVESFGKDASLAVTSPFNSKGAISSKSTIFTKNNKEYTADTNTAAICSGGDTQIDSYYTGDVHITPSFKKDFSYIDVDSKDLDIPMLMDALKQSYELERHKLTLGGYSINPKKFIHRNNVGIKVEVTKSVYPKSLLGFEYKVGFGEKKGVAEEPVEYFSLVPATYSETSTLHLPWIGQIREIYKRLTYYAHDNNYRYFTPSENYNNTLKKVENALDKGTGLNGTIFGSISDSVDGKPLTLFETARGMLRQELNIMNCRDIDAFKAKVQKLTNPGKNPTNLINALAKEIDNTDCYDDADKYEDPLQTYLCQKGALPAVDCGGVVPAKAIPDACIPYTNPGDINFVSGLKSPIATSQIRVSQCQGDGSGIDYCAASKNSAYLKSQDMCSFHTGLDFGNTMPNQQILAAADGIVVHAKQNDGNSGNNVLIYHPHLKLWTKYLHLQSFVFQPFDEKTPESQRPRIKAGQVLGIMGNTGFSGGTHLHFDVMKCLDYKKECFLNAYSLVKEFDKGRLNCKVTDVFTSTGTGSNGGATNPDDGKGIEAGDGLQFPDSYPTNESSDPTSVPDECKPYVPTPSVEGSNKNYACLMVKVANTVNKELSGDPKKGIPWEVLWATIYNETKARCTPSHRGWLRQMDENRLYPTYQTPGGNTIQFFKDACTGDPNQLGLYEDTNEVDGRGRGVGQFMPGSFDAITSDSYWYGPKSINTEAVFEACQRALGIDTSKGAERNVSSPAFQNANSFNNYRPDDFSRARAGDSLCAAAIMLAQNAQGRGENINYSAVNVDWSLEQVAAATRPYYGSCNKGYCNNAYDRYLFARQFFYNSNNEFNVLDCNK